MASRHAPARSDCTSRYRARPRLVPLEDRLAPSAYSVTDLGTLGAANAETLARGLNERGQVVGESVTPGGAFHAFLWTPGVPNGQVGSLADLGTLPGASSSSAYGVNDSGAVAGTSDGTAFVWTDGRAHPLQPLPGNSSGRAYAINNRGQVAGWSGNVYYMDGAATLWGQDGRPSYLKTIGNMPNVARAVNESGQAAGLVGLFPPSPSARAVVWAGDDLKRLGTIASPWGSEGLGLDDHGDVVGISHVGEQTWVLSHPFLYTRQGQIQDLGAPDCGSGAHGYGAAQGINNGGLVVGYRGCVNGSFQSKDHAAVWDLFHGWQTLQDLVAPDSGWDLTYATAVNDHGQIVGYGYHAPYFENYHGFLLTPQRGFPGRVGPHRDAIPPAAPGSLPAALAPQASVAGPGAPRPASSAPAVPAGTGAVCGVSAATPHARGSRPLGSWGCASDEDLLLAAGLGASIE
jgi:probable HAF family extracellular repeat protein